MPFQFAKASCVVVGTFNMYILNPLWLKRHEIVDAEVLADGDLVVEMNLARPGFRYKLPNAVWTVAPDRISIETKDVAFDAGNTVARILRALPETPLYGIGNNAMYEASATEESETIRAIRYFPSHADSSESEAVARRTFHYSIDRDEHEVFNLQMSVSLKRIELSCNAHTKLEDRTEANEAAIAAASRFFDDRECAERLANEYFEARIEPWCSSKQG